VEITTTTPGAVVHYTTDGSAPTADSPVYSGPITVEKTTTVQAIAIAPGMPPSTVTSGTYSIAPPAPPRRVVVTKERLELKEKVFFETGKTAVRAESFGLLDDVATALKENADVKKVVIEGHTDDRGAKTANQRLSKGRAEAVRAYLVKKGVEPGRLEAKGVGEDRPIADNATAKGREENRRVEFVIPQS
jgi:outer membrane protein OmpA-like peptidoglycan-associated protein